ncbi:MAG: DNA replication/repair protein RecF [Gammaproteobacteria bacterium]|nr:DNA replication/repair protein RecF [Gammaproteobacteria bacterium]
MRLESLQVLNVRRLQDARLEATAETNLIWGPNGSGKTSILEAIHLLGTGRSFRSHKAGEVITHGAASLVVAGTVREAPNSALRSLGIEKTSSTTRIRADGEPLKSASQLADALPVLTLTADSYHLLDGGPAIRRALLDRTLFHVEHAYLEKLKRAYRALQQRNELLRKGEFSRIEIWNAQFVVHAEEMDQIRRGATDRLNRLLAEFSASNDLPEVALDYRRGWKAGMSLAELLEQHSVRDREMGFTGDGPHRAEVRISCAGRPAAQVVSRGQGKLVLAVLLAAHAELIAEKSGRRPVLLVDDLAAELDRTSVRKALSTLLGTRCQTFLTTIEPEVFANAIDASTKVFHVEQGKIRSSQAALA